MNKIIFIVFLFLGTVITKNVSSVQAWIPFSKFNQFKGWVAPQQLSLYLQGQSGHVKIKAKIQGDYVIRKTFELSLSIVPSIRWEQEVQKKCQAPKKMPIFSKRIQYNKGQVVTPMAFGIQGDGTYRFVIKDCFNVYKKQYQNDKLLLYIQVSIDQPAKKSYRESVANKTQAPQAQL